MKAVVYEKYGSPDVLELKEVAKPQPSENEVLVKVCAASVNSWDWDMLTGKPYEYRLFFGLLKPKMTKILGCDIAGRVEAVGKNVKQLKPGDEVFGDLSGGAWGGFAEYASAREDELTLKPPCLTFEEAAAAPQAGLLALQALQCKKEIKPGDKVLINGGGGGMGTFAIQIIKTFGAEITGVDSAEKLDAMLDLGADHAIDFSEEDFTKTWKRYDLILDVKTNRSIFSYKRVLSPNGVYATVGGKSFNILQIAFLGPLLEKAVNKKFVLVMHKPNKGLDVLNDFFEAGKVKPIVDSYFPLEKTPEAFRRFGEGGFKGKVVVTMEH